MKYAILVSIVSFCYSIKLKPSSDTKLFLRSGRIIETHLGVDDLSNASFTVLDDNDEMLNIVNEEIDSIQQSESVFVNLSLLSSDYGVGFAERITNGTDNLYHINSSFTEGLKLVVRQNGEEVVLQESDYISVLNKMYPTHSELNELVESHTIEFDELDQVIEMANDYGTGS